MGEYIPTTVKFGGKLKAEHVDELIELLKDKGFATQSDDEEPDPTNLNEKFRAEEVNYGQIDEIIDFCATHGLDYEHWCDAAGGGDPYIVRCHAGEVVNTPADEGDPTLRYSELLKVENMLDGFAKLIAEAKWWAGDLTLEIVP